MGVLIQTNNLSRLAVFLSSQQIHALTGLR